MLACNRSLDLDLSRNIIGFCAWSDSISSGSFEIFAIRYWSYVFLCITVVNLFLFTPNIGNQSLPSTLDYYQVLFSVVFAFYKLRGDVKRIRKKDQYSLNRKLHRTSFSRINTYDENTNQWLVTYNRYRNILFYPAIGVHEYPWKLRH